MNGFPQIQEATDERTADSEVRAGRVKPSACRRDNDSGSGANPISQ